MGWPMGFEPTTTGITIRDSTVELRPPLTATLDSASRSQRYPGLPDWTRTSDPQLRRLMLYPTELRADRTCWAIGDNAARCYWSGREDSNLRPPAPKAGALPGCATPRTARMISDFGEPAE